MAAPAARPAPGGEEEEEGEEEEGEEEEGVDDWMVADEGDALEGSPPEPWLPSDDAETRTRRGGDSEGLVKIKIERSWVLRAAGEEGEDDITDFAVRALHRRCGLLARCTRGCSLAEQQQQQRGEDVDAASAEKLRVSTDAQRRRSMFFSVSGGGEGVERERERERRGRRVHVFFSSSSSFLR